MTDIFANINGIKICYDIHGAGEPLILIHGFTSKKETFVAQIPELPKYFRVIRIDNRGSGKSEKPNEPYTMDMFVDDVRGLMDYLEIESSNILGYSLGGMIAQSFALKYPERLNKLILLNTMSQIHVKEEALEGYVQNRIKNYEEKLTDPEKAFFNSAPLAYSYKFINILKADLKRKFHNAYSVEDLIKESTIDPATPQDIRNQVKSFLQFDVHDQLKKINNPTLIIGGKFDKQTPKRWSIKIHEQIPNSKLLILEAGHSANKEKAPEVNRAIIDFLKN
jgi:proline-specific peptidase